MAGVLSSLVTPAIVAAAISLLVSNRMEKIRAQRDFVTKAFDPARDTVKSAVEAGLEYYPLPASDRTKVFEAKILAAEREVRRSISALIEMNGELQTQSLAKVEIAFDIFVAELTGGSFQFSEAVSDVATAIKVADAGADLRAKLIILRSEILERAIANDPLSSIPSMWDGALRYIGFR